MEVKIPAAMEGSRAAISWTIFLSGATYMQYGGTRSEARCHETFAEDRWLFMSFFNQLFSISWRTTRIVPSL